MWYNKNMNNEIEAQFLDINKDEIREKLVGIGAKCEKPEVLMQRVVLISSQNDLQECAMKVVARS